MTPADELERCDLNYVEAFRDMTRRGGGTVLDEGGLSFYVGKHWLPVLQNGVFRTDRSVPAAEVLARTAAFFAARGRGYTVTLLSGDADLDAAASAAGLARMGDMPGMVLRRRLAEAVAPKGMSLVRVETDRDVRDYATVMQAAYATYGMPDGVMDDAMGRREVLVGPHVAAMLVREGSVPLAGAMTLVSHGVAGIYWVGTTPNARGRGLAELVTRAAGNLGMDMGGRIAALQASPMGEPVYTRMGYETVTRYPYLVQMTPPGA